MLMEETQHWSAVLIVVEKVLQDMYLSWYINLFVIFKEAEDCSLVYMQGRICSNSSVCEFWLRNVMKELEPVQE